MSYYGFDYKYNTKAWMTAVIFTEWLTTVNYCMRIDDCRILMLLNHFSGNTTMVKSINISNITVHPLPPNMPCVLQPCDAGIIRAFKAYYCHDFISQAIQRYEDNPNWTSKQVYNVNILEAMQMVGRAWDQVTAATIRNCWLHTGIIGAAPAQSLNVLDDGIHQQSIAKDFDLNLAIGAVVASSIVSITVLVWRRFGQDFVSVLINY